MTSLIAYKKYKRSVSAFRSTALLCAKQVFDGNLLCVAGEYLVLLLRFAALVLLWKSLAAQGADFGMPVERLLSYTLISSVLRQQLEIVSPATSALWEGSIAGRYTRPVPIIASLAAETVGRWWIPVFLFYSLPLLLLSPVFGINPLPASVSAGGLFSVSLFLSILIGFALDLIFASAAIRMKNGCWAAVQIRESITALASGALIPFSMFPARVGTVLAYLPLGSVANAPLTVYTGTAENPCLLILTQTFWAAALWTAARKGFHKSEERMISFGG